jgi:hypothetical protein
MLVEVLFIFPSYSWLCSLPYKDQMSSRDINNPLSFLIWLKDLKKIRLIRVNVFGALNQKESQLY